MVNPQRYRVEEVVEEYTAGNMTRREFLRRLTLLTGSALVAVQLAASLGCGVAEPPKPTAAPVTPTPAPVPTPIATPEPGVTVRPDDPSLEAGAMEFQSGGITLLGYRAKPKGAGPFPAMLVIHENRGLLPHFPDVARRLAKAGYVALALDLVSREGGTGKFTDPVQAGDVLRQASPDRLVEDASGGVGYLQSLPYVRRDRIGMMGFCFGGRVVWLLSVRNPAVRAAIPFYGARPPLEEVPNLRAAVLGIYAENDQGINAGVPELEAALKQHNKTYKFTTYPGTSHAFFNDTGARYHPEAAAAAWKETLAWLDQHLKG